VHRSIAPQQEWKRMSGARERQSEPCLGGLQTHICDGADLGWRKPVSQRSV
jgi:hypothetical protein